MITNGRHHVPVTPIEGLWKTTTTSRHLTAPIITAEPLSAHQLVGVRLHGQCLVAHHLAHLLEALVGKRGEAVPGAAVAAIEGRLLVISGGAAGGHVSRRVQ